MNKLVEVWENVVARIIFTGMCYCSGLLFFFYLIGIIEIKIIVENMRLVFDMKTLREKKRTISVLMGVTMIILGIVIIAIIH